MKANDLNWSMRVYPQRIPKSLHNTPTFRFTPTQDE